ncbi:GNAT family N-acetyltransferase [Bacillus sp. EB01]|uniref:GNAT family N-acetyltransferase n=1 Tax=Bacillus sp. EB01 TaxID=1347086 RepID=UPI002F3597AE
MGTVGFHYLRGQGGVTKAEVGYDLSKRYWGNGFMVEAMKKAISFGFQQMELDVIDATVDENNQRSIQLLKKLGFSVDEKYKKGNELYFYLERNEG